MSIGNYDPNVVTTRRVWVNPVTGKAETIRSFETPVTQADVDRTRRELRDMLDGNVQFHVDPLAAPPSAEPTPADIVSIARVLGLVEDADA